jgi:Spy/CpxP family protein refolding chaperone
MTKMGVGMKTKHIIARGMAWTMILILALPPELIAQQKTEAAPVLKQEELEQVLAPIALHPDPLVAQILMASTYPLEVVQADRWAKQNASLKGDALTKALESQSWDPSIKSLVNFPQVLTMMSEKLDWTQKLGDAFLADQKKVMDTIQSLRAKAQASGNLKTTKEQTVIVEEKIIKIEPASPQVVYVPTYNPTVVYGAWPYPAYPPYYYYPPGYVATSMFAFGAGVAMGAAWGYAWGNCNWGGGDVDVDINRNTNINNNINRDQAKQKLQERGQVNQKGQGKWQHSPEHRQGVSYRDQGTAQKFNRASTNDQIKSREQFRGRAEQGRQDLGRGGGAGVSDRASGIGGAGQRPGAGGAGQAGSGSRGPSAGTMDRGAGGVGGGSSSRGGAFQGVDRGGSGAASASQRGSASRASSGGGARSGGGGSRGGGGGSRGGGGGGGGRRR